MTTSSKSGEYGNVVRRGAVPSVTGWCVGVMAWCLVAVCEITIQKAVMNLNHVLKLSNLYSNGGRCHARPLGN